MERIKEVKITASFGEFGEKVNELVKAVNTLYEDLEILEGPIYEKLALGECLIISRSTKGELLVARNEGGRVLLERVHCVEPKKEEKE